VVFSSINQHLSRSEAGSFGARFQPSLTGSSVFVGSSSLEDAYALKDGDGMTLGEALAAINYRGSSPLELKPVRYVELDVEQGDRLERAAADIAAVSGAWTVRKMSVVFEGEASHTGPMPMAERRDAMRAAARATSHEDLDRIRRAQGLALVLVPVLRGLKPKIEVAIIRESKLEPPDEVLHLLDQLRRSRRVRLANGRDPSGSPEGRRTPE
jgi:acetylornithine deacetylase/succinyl-diaminopimelate desuccinylase-like protein